MKRDQLGSRVGFILLSAGCAIGCGNVWKFPWMCGKHGGGGFVLIYILCLLLLGLPAMVMEFAMGRASQAIPDHMYHKLEEPGQKWHIQGYICFVGNICLMAFYTVVTGWMMYYFARFLSGTSMGLSFEGMITSPGVNVLFLALAVAIGFAVLTFDIQKGLEKISKYMMLLLLVLMLVLAIKSVTLPGGMKGLYFYLVPDFTAINGKVIVGAMNQAFFTLSVGMGSMAIFGSYIGKEHSLAGESVNIIILDTFVAIVAGMIIFPACTSFNIEVTSGPALLFNTMATVFNSMNGGRIWGSLFFLFMVFAALSTELAVCENILACVREITGWNRKKGSLICGIGIFLISLTTALGFSTLSGFTPFAKGSSWLDFWDFIVSNNILPLGALLFAIFCCSDRFGWGWDNFVAEANAGKGIKIKNWMKPIFKYFVPLVTLGIYIYGLITFNWK